MENFLIVIIFIGSIVYKIYTNYKKEMETAKNRNPHRKPAVPVNSYPTAQEVRIPTKSVPSTVPAYPNETKTNTYDSVYQSDSIPEEVRKLTEARQHPKTKIKLKETEVSHTERRPKIEFDLRQAVIQAAILERPYQ